MKRLLRISMLLFLSFFYFRETFSYSEKIHIYTLALQSNLQQNNEGNLFLEELKNFSKQNNIQGLLSKAMLEVIESSPNNKTIQPFSINKNQFLMISNLDEKTKEKLKKTLENEIENENSGWSQNEPFINHYTGKLDFDYFISNCISVVNNNKIIGFLKYRIIENGNIATIFMIKVNENFQRKNIGQLLFKYAEREVFNSVKEISSTEILSVSLPFWKRTVGANNIIKENLGNTIKYHINIKKSENTLDSSKNDEAPSFIQKILDNLASLDYKEKSIADIFTIINNFFKDKENDIFVRMTLNSKYFKVFLSKVIKIDNQKDINPIFYNNNSSISS